MYVQREDDMKTQGIDGHLPAKERGLEQILPSWTSEKTSTAYTVTVDSQPTEL